MASKSGWQLYGEKSTKRGVCRQWEATILWLGTESKETGWRLQEVPQIAPAAKWHPVWESWLIPRTPQMSTQLSALAPWFPTVWHWSNIATTHL